METIHEEQKLKDTHASQAVLQWLHSLGMNQYHRTFIDGGFSDMQRVSS